MYELNWTENEVADLHDEFLVNTEQEFWEFINEEIDTAYYLGMHFDKWFKELKDLDKQFLYSISARHCNDDLDKYQDQVSFWSKKYTNKIDSNEVDMVDMSEFILNHIIFQPEDEDLIINLAFMLGKVTGKELFKDETT